MISQVLPDVKLYINSAREGAGDMQMLLPLESLVENPDKGGPAK